MKNRVLVVEDNKFNRELLCDWLEMEGYDVRAAEGLEAAFEEVQSRTPDVVLLDIQLGTDDGLSLVTWMRQQPTVKSVPVIAVTAHAMVTDQGRMLMAGCNVCVSKPVDFKILSDHLQKWLSAVHA